LCAGGTRNGSRFACVGSHADTGEGGIASEDEWRSLVELGLVPLWDHGGPCAQAKPGFAAALDMVKAGIDHHVGDEEDEMFPELREKAAGHIRGLEPEKLEAVIDLTKDQLYRKAKEAGIEGRSDMTRDELARAVAERS
jgi:hypothetical protein